MQVETCNIEACIIQDNDMYLVIDLSVKYRKIDGF